MAASCQRLLEDHEPAHPSRAADHIGAERLFNGAEPGPLVRPVCPDVADGRCVTPHGSQGTSTTRVCSGSRDGHRRFGQQVGNDDAVTAACTV
jgi:hypothetical protein